MSSVAPIDLDTSRMSPAELEFLGQVGFSNDRISAYLPVLLATYLDAVAFGVVVVLFYLWMQHARPSEGLINRVLVISPARDYAELVVLPGLHRALRDGHHTWRCHDKAHFWI